MSDDNFTPFFIILLGASVLGVFLGAAGATVTERSATQQDIEEKF